MGRAVGFGLEPRWEREEQEVSLEAVDGEIILKEVEASNAL
jgi:hypothetical protein